MTEQQPNNAELQLAITLTTDSDGYTNFTFEMPDDPSSRFLLDTLFKRFHFDMMENDGHLILVKNAEGSWVLSIEF